MNASIFSTQVDRCPPIGCLLVVGQFLQKSPVINGSFAGNELRVKVFGGVSPPKWQKNSINYIKIMHKTITFGPRRMHFILCPDSYNDS